VVAEGDLLVTLENPELLHELNSLVIDIHISELTAKSLFNDGRISEVQLEQESLKSMLETKADLELRVSELKIYAPQAGAVIARDLDSMNGSYFQPGSEILSIGKPGEIQAIALTRQSDIEWVEENPDAEIELLVWGRHQSDMIKGQIHLINPRARDDIPHEAFSASAGGPLAVVPRSQVSSETGESDGEMVLTQPRVTVEIELADKFREQLVPGQTGLMMVRGRNESGQQRVRLL